MVSQLKAIMEDKPQVIGSLETFTSAVASSSSSHAVPSTTALSNSVSPPVCYTVFSTIASSVFDLEASVERLNGHKSDNDKDWLKGI